LIVEIEEEENKRDFIIINWLFKGEIKLTRFAFGFLSSENIFRKGVLRIKNSYFWNLLILLLNIVCLVSFFY
jgi:hypothetical protein